MTGFRRQRFVLLASGSVGPDESISVVFEDGIPAAEARIQLNLSCLIELFERQIAGADTSLKIADLGIERTDDRCSERKQRIPGTTTRGTISVFRIVILDVERCIGPRSFADDRAVPGLGTSLRRVVRLNGALNLNVRPDVVAQYTGRLSRQLARC